MKQKRIAPCNNKRKKVDILGPYSKVRHNGTVNTKPKFNRTKRNRPDYRPDGTTTTNNNDKMNDTFHLLTTCSKNNGKTFEAIGIRRLFRCRYGILLLNVSYCCCNHHITREDVLSFLFCCCCCCCCWNVSYIFWYQFRLRFLIVQNRSIQHCVSNQRWHRRRIQWQRRTMFLIAFLLWFDRDVDCNFDLYLYFNSDFEFDSVDFVFDYYCHHYNCRYSYKQYIIIFVFILI